MNIADRNFNGTAQNFGSLLRNGLTLKQNRDGIIERTKITGFYDGLAKLEFRDSDPIRYQKLFSKLRGGLVHAARPPRRSPRAQLSSRRRTVFHPL